MLKLSTKGLYGIKALYELASNYGDAPLNIREISRRHGMPVPFLEQVLHRLKQKGLVESRRGINGGY
ncbi:MAG: Rrf2 family transcriptional regulator, partial [Candidatus Latescibacteria bacterium]|nr:Rrf2 family transcriptional regulator [Candidatus Latescibacterota bacterium]